MIIDGVEYVRADQTIQPNNPRVIVRSKEAARVIVRSKEAGVFAGLLESRCGSEVVLTNARRLWYWAGAATLSELAMVGTGKPKECKFPMAVSTIAVLGVCEIIPMTADAWNSIMSAPVWSES